MMEYFRRFGHDVASQWCRLNFDENAFAGIAEQALADALPSAAISPMAIVDWGLSEGFTPLRRGRGWRFGQPGATLYVSPNGRFYVEALFWTDGTTAIHQHAFSGAFHVLWGSSVHAEYRFTTTRVVNEGFLVGALDLHQLERLAPGDTRRIRAGPRLVHSLYHLDVPSVTIVVRTAQERAAGVQFGYDYPGVAYDPLRDDERRRCQLELLDVLAALEPQRLRVRVEELIRSADLESTYFLLQHCARGGTENSIAKHVDLPALFAAAEQAHGAVVREFVDAVRFRRRQATLAGARTHTWDPELRLFLGLLLNACSAASFVQLVRDTRPGLPPEQLIKSWLLSAAGERLWSVIPQSVSPDMIVELLMTGAPDSCATRHERHFEALRRSSAFGVFFDRPSRRAAAEPTYAGPGAETVGNWGAAKASAAPPRVHVDPLRNEEPWTSAGVLTAIRESLRRHGVVVVDRLSPEDDTSFVALAAALGEIVVVGSIVPGHPLDGGFAYRVESLNDGAGIVDSDGLVMYSTTASEFPCHTDGFCSESPADVVLLVCVRADPRGGASFVAHVDDILADLPAETVALLRDPAFPSIAGSGPILYGTPENPRIRFNQLEITRAATEAPGYSPLHRAAVARVVESASFARARHRVHLNPGECLLMDNRKVLHGRGELSPHSGRLLKRLWVRTK